MVHEFLSPIENRYRSDISKFFTEDYKLKLWLNVEATLAEVQAQLGIIPQEAAKEIRNRIDSVKIERVKEIDKDIHHDLMAMVKALAEQCENDAGNYVHLGATSYDIEDTATALQLKEALKYLEANVKTLLNVIYLILKERRGLVCIGRTHGQQAIPTTYGMRFGVWGYEIDRHIDRMNECIDRISYGKMSGAVGTMASFKDNGIEIQELVMNKLNLKPVLVANQIIQRDRIAEVIFVLVLIGQTLAKISREGRILQRTEIGEMYEPFKSSQVGSSTMPHKRNPHKFERICSLARVLKSNLIIALDNIVLEDERDLTNSASERIIIPESFVLLDFMISQLISIFKGIEINEERIKLNLDLTNGGIFAEKIMIELVNKGIGRQTAHEILRQFTIKARSDNSRLIDVLRKDDRVNNKFTESELANLFKPENYIGKALEIVDNLITHLNNKYVFE